jgi:hypothetical protein
MATLQEQYNSIKSGSGNKDQFLKQARYLFPEYFNQYTDFNTAANVLKSKQIINEAAGGVVSKGFDIWDWKKILAEEVKAEEKATSKEVLDDQKNSYDNSDMKNADNVNFNEIMKGFYAEMRDEKNAGKTGDEIKAMVVKNLAKDPLFYTKDGMFGEKGVGYTDEAPGLGTPKEPKGKHKASGYGDLDVDIKIEKVKSNVQDSLGDREANTSNPKKVKEMPDKGVTGVEKKMKLQESIINENEDLYQQLEDLQDELMSETDPERKKEIENKIQSLEAGLDEVRGGGNYGIPTISTKGGGGGKRFIPTSFTLPTMIKNRFKNHIYFEDNKLYISSILYNFITGLSKDPKSYITALMRDLDPGLKGVLSKSYNYESGTKDLSGKKLEYKSYHQLKGDTKETDKGLEIPNLNRPSEKITEDLVEQKLRSLIRSVIKEALNEYGEDSGGQDMTSGMYNRSITKKDQGNKDFIDKGKEDFIDDVPFEACPYEEGYNEYYKADLAKLWQMGWKEAEAKAEDRLSPKADRDIPFQGMTEESKYEDTMPKYRLGALKKLLDISIKDGSSQDVITHLQNAIQSLEKQA